MYDIAVLPVPEFAARAGEIANAHMAVLIEQPDADFANVRLSVGQWRDHATPRALHGAEYVQEAARHFAAAGGHAPGDDVPRTTVFQVDDAPRLMPSVSWERRSDWHDIRLVPDLYYFFERGYENYLPEIPAWRTRRAAIVWRGATTGLIGFDEGDLDRLPRYRLCREARSLGHHADICFSNVVQANSDEQAAAITARLTDEKVLGDFLPMPDMAHFKFVADIDGNTNSWNFMAKLRLGACVLRVDSDWEQWFSADLVAWEHYVPVAKDLSDFAAKLDWCLSHDGECERIAQQGRAFAQRMRFDDEMLKAARTLFT